jgi:hypothetical protein
MTAATPVSRWARSAVDQVARVSRGGPLDRRLRVTLNFHPDRLVGDRTVIECLADDQLYRSQFETGISNGGLTAHPGGDRWRWEQRIFAGAYDDAPAEERPKYGALDHRRTGVGGAIRFGSCHLRLAEQVLDRTTFCFPDSVLEPTDFGTAARCELVPLADTVEARPHTDRAEAEIGGRLDSYVEAHVHGQVRLDTDVEAIMLDPSFRGTEIEDAARRAGPMIGWTEGRVLTVSELVRHPDFRGPTIVALGRALAEEDQLTARVIGATARRGEHDQQQLKKLWHLVARFGQPARN